MKRAKFTIQVQIEIEYDENEYGEPDEAAQLFIQEADYGFHYPEDKIVAVYTEIFDQSNAELVDDEN